MSDDATRNANVVLTADTSNYSRQVTAAGQQTNTLNDSVNKLITSIDRLTKTSGRRLEIVSASTIAGLTAAGLAAAKFESQMSALNATMALAQRPAGEVQRTVDNLRRSLPLTTEQVISLVSSLQKLGASPGGMAKLVDTFTKLSAVTGEDISGLAQGMVQLQRQMGTSEGSTTKFANAVAGLSANLGVSATGILQFSQSLAPVARTVGMTQTEVMGFSAAFLRAGQDGYVAGNTFTKMLSDISRAARYGSTDLAMFANVAGKTVDEFKAMPAAQQITAIFDALNRSGPDAIKVLERMGYDGPRAMKAIQGLVQSGGLSQALNEATGQFNSGSGLQKGADALHDFNDTMTKLRNNVTSLAQDFGSTFLPLMSKIAEAFVKMTDGVHSVINAFGPLMKILGTITGLGGVATGVTGFALSNFTGLGSIAAAVMLARSPLRAGMAQARNVRSGRAIPGMLSRTVDSMEEGAGTGFQRFMYGMGQNLVNVPGRARGWMTGDERSGRERAGAWVREGGGIGGRLAMLGSGVAQGAIGLMTSTVDPIRLSKVMDATARVRGTFQGSRDAFSAAFSGQGASGSRALTGVVTSLGKFSGALISATAGIGRLGATMGMSAARRGLGAAGSAVMGFLGGPVGLGLTAAAIGTGYVMNGRADQAAFGQELKDANGANAAVNKYASAMGLAATSALSFADTLKKAEKSITYSSVDQALQIQPGDVTSARTAGRQLTDASIGNMTVKQATAYAGTMLKTGTPATAAAMKLDLIQQFGPQVADQILSGAKGNPYDISGLLDTSQAATSGFWGGFTRVFKAGDKFQAGVKAAGSSVDVNRADLQSKYGSGEANKFTVATINQILDRLANPQNTKGSQHQLGQLLEQELGGSLKLDQGVMNDLTRQDYTPEQRTAAFRRFMTRTQTGQNFLSSTTGLGFDLNSRSYAPPTSATDSTLVMRNKETFAGRVAYSDNTMGKSVQYALNNQDNTNAQLQAATGWADWMTKLTGSTQGAANEFQQLKAQIGDVNDPLYKLADSAQQAANRLQGYAMAQASPQDNARQLLGNLAGSYRATGPDAQQQQVSAEDAYMNAQASLKGQLTNIVKAYREYGIQRSRSETDFNLQRGRAESDFALQRKYSQYDFNLSRARGENDYQVSRARGQADFDLQRSISERNFNLSRTRSETDYNHQLVLMARQTAQQMTDIYTRITVQRTWSSSNLLANSNDQLAKMRQQQSDLSTLQGMGVSGDVISMLGLNQFTNQQQLARMVSDLAKDPSLVQAWNDSIKGRLDMGKAFSQDPNSEAYKEMEYQFHLTADRAAADFQTMVDDSNKSYQISLSRMNEDYAKSVSRAEQDYQTMTKRQAEAFALSEERMVTDQKTQLDRAAEDLNRSFETINGTFNDLAQEALKNLHGATQSQMQELVTALGQTRDQVKTEAAGLSQDLITALIPLFGSKDAVLAALKQPASVASGVQRMGLGDFRNTGGPSGSENSYAAAMGGADVGTAATSKVLFPLPAGSYTKSSGFGMRVNPVSGIRKLHEGNDYAAKMGTAISAAEDGVVVRAGALGGLGNMVAINHGNGIQSWYGHMSAIATKVGSYVHAGDLIGRVGSTGNSTGPHLHFQLMVNGTAVDPSAFLAGASGFGAASARAAFAAPDMSSNKHLMAIEDLLTAMPGGTLYDKGRLTDALNGRIGAMGNAPLDGWYGQGSIFKGPRTIGVGEGGPEAVLPLNERGADFLAATMAKYAVPTSPKAMGSQVVSPVTTSTTYQTYDQRTTYTGGITVVSNDPLEMERKLEERKRLKALTGGRR